MGKCPKLKKIIKLGRFAKKAWLTIVCIVTLLLESVAQNYWYTKRRGNIVVSLFMNAIAKILSIIIYIPLKIFYYKSKLIENVEEGNSVKQNRLKNHILFFLLIFLYQIVYEIIYIIYYVQSRIKSAERKKETGNSLIYLAHSYGIFTLENIQIIIIFFITKFLLKYEYTKQDIISLIIFTISSVLIDIINYENFFDALGGLVIFILIFINLFLESVTIIFEKILMDKFFMSPFLVCVLFGSIELLFSIILGIISFVKDGWFCNGKTCYIANFLDYFENFETSDIISFVVNIIVKSIIYILNAFVLYYLTPNHFLLAYIVGKFVENMIERQEKIIENIIVFVFLLISFMFYLEIFELNFCGINRDTKSNVERRALSESNYNNKLLEKINEEFSDAGSLENN